MSRFSRLLLIAFATLAPFAFPTPARADKVKSALFIFGIHTAGIEGVAGSFRGQPTDRHPGAMALIKRNLNWSMDVADDMKWDYAELAAMSADVDRLTFAQMEDTMSALRASYVAKFAKNINPGAGAYFIIGIQHNGAERTAEGVTAFPRDKKPGSGMLIQRNLNWLKDSAPPLKLSTGLLLKIDADHMKGATFATTSAALAKLRLDWAAELTAQPGFGGSIILSKDDSITKADPRDAVRKDSFAKIFTVRLKAGKKYIIDVQSGDGRAGPHNPGFFDTWLRVEDTSGKTLAYNDDGGDNLNSRLEFTPPADADYRLVVTTYRSNDTGNFSLKVREP